MNHHETVLYVYIVLFTFLLLWRSIYEIYMAELSLLAGTLDGLQTFALPSSLSEQAVQRVEALVAVMRGKIAQIPRKGKGNGPGAELELEARMGIFSSVDGRFKPGVAPEEMDHIIKLLESCAEWTSTDDWQESVVYYYTLPDGRSVRTTTTTTSAASSGTLFHVQKMAVANPVLLHTSPFKATGSQHVRISAGAEVLVSEQDLPASILPTHVRIRQRKSFTRGNWRYDLTRVWEGNSYSAVEATQATTAPIHEVELECTGITDMFKDLTDVYIATSLLLKVLDLFMDRNVSLALTS